MKTVFLITWDSEYTGDFRQPEIIFSTEAGAISWLASKRMHCTNEAAHNEFGAPKNYGKPNFDGTYNIKEMKVHEDL